MKIKNKYDENPKSQKNEKNLFFKIRKKTHFFEFYQRIPQIFWEKKSQKNEKNRFFKIKKNTFFSILP